MYYKEVIEPSRVQEYQDMHKLFYRTLSSMIFDISFIESCCKLNNFELNTDWITINSLYKNVYENLIMKVSRCFFDTKGNNVTSLSKFKNLLLNEFLKEEFRSAIKKEIEETEFEDKIYKKKREKIETNILALRNNYIAHGLIEKQIDDSVSVDLANIKELVEKGCLLFQKLSFKPLDFYSFMEGDGYDFSKEFNYTQLSTELFIKYSMLSSSHISSIKCCFSEYSTEEEIHELKNILLDINNDKNKHSE